MRQVRLPTWRALVVFTYLLENHMPRDARRFIPITLMLAFATPAFAVAQVADEQVREVLTTSKAAQFLGAVATQMVELITTTHPAKDTAVVNGAIRTHFATDSLLAHVVRHMKAEAEPVSFSTLRQWLLADSIRTLELKGDTAADKESLEQYAIRVSSNMPPVDRLQLVVQFVEAQQAGEFYVRFVQALRSGAAEIGKAAASREAIAGQLTAAEAEQTYDQFMRITIVSFLQRMEPLSNSEVRRLVSAYESPAGQWYVEAYIAAVASAIRQAAAAAAEGIR